MAWDFSGRGGGLQADGGLDRSRGGRCFLRGVRLRLSGGVWAEVRQRQGDGSHVVDSQQDLHGVDLLEALIRQSLARPLNLLDARRERTDPTAWRRTQREQMFKCRSSCPAHISTFRWIAMKCCADIHGPQRLNHTDFNDPQ